MAVELFPVLKEEEGGVIAVGQLEILAVISHVAISLTTPVAV